MTCPCPFKLDLDVAVCCIPGYDAGEAARYRAAFPVVGEGGGGGQGAL